MDLEKIIESDYSYSSDEENNIGYENLISGNCFIESEDGSAKASGVLTTCTYLLLTFIFQERSDLNFCGNEKTI